MVNERNETMKTAKISIALCVMKNFIVGTMLALMCGGVVGCSDRVEFKWGGRGNMSIAGFIDDSLVVAYDCRGWLETTETWNGGYSEDASCGHDRFLVYNYRVQEEGPRWSDSLTNKSGGYRWYQLTDSIFWRWEENNILLWKLRGEAHEIKLSRKNEGCSETFDVDRMHQWKNGMFIALGGKLSAKGDSCQYAVLDTTARTLTYERLEKNLEWIQKCDDVRTWGEDVYCIAMLNNPKDLFLLKNNENLDSLIHGDDYKWTENSIVVFSGQILNLSGNIGLLKDNRIEIFSSADLKELMFRNIGGSLISY